MAYLTFDELIEWINSEDININDESEVIKFTENLQEKIKEMNFNLSEGCEALGYAGSVDSNIIHNL